MIIKNIFSTLKLSLFCIILASTFCSATETKSLSTDKPDNDAKSLYQEAENYYRGNGVDQDLHEAAKWYGQAAKLGHQQAQNKLAYLYETGQGVEQDLAVAFSWYKKAADAGYLTAQYNMAEKYRLGIGVEKDEQLAIEWCRRAALAGHRIAMKRLADYFEKGVGGERDYARALAWYNVAIELGTLVPFGMKYSLESKMNQTELFQSENITRDIRKLMAKQQ